MAAPATSIPMLTERQRDIIRAARSWIGTPYQHQASAKGAGTDCLGLIRGVWREVVGREAMPPPPYTPDWARRAGRETLLLAAQACLKPMQTTEAGQVLAFRLRPDWPVTHIGLLTDRGLLHAYAGRGVIEHPFVPFWRRRHTHSFSFPEIAP